MEFTGKSDFLKFYKYILLKEERKTEKKNKRRTEQNRSANVVEVDVEETFESFQFEKLSAFSVPIMMSPIARTPRREREAVPIPEANHIVVSQNEEEQVIYSGDLNNILVRLFDHRHVSDCCMVHYSDHHLNSGHIVSIIRMVICIRSQRQLV